MLTVQFKTDILTLSKITLESQANPIVKCNKYTKIEEKIHEALKEHFRKLIFSKQLIILT